MDEHVHEWEMRYNYVCPECKICGAAMTLTELESRLNATERLKATKAQLYSEHIIEEPPFLIDECAADLKAYADILDR
jgi:hypothetical protein